MNNEHAKPTAAPVAATVCLLAALFAATPARAADADAHPWWRPDAVFGQVGAGDRVKSTTIGVSWDWNWHAQLSTGLLTGSTEASLGQWRGTRGPDDEYTTQFGITPALRLYPGGTERGWFLEAGAGANVTSPTYHNGDRRFSTTFNFGEHIGVGQRFGPHAEHELALRVQHLSNAGIRKPNPGENFVQLRYVRHF